MKLKDIVQNIDKCDIRGNVNADICGIAYSSSLVKKGFCFFAIRGEKNDGHDFAQDAVSRGASVIVSERPLQLPRDVVNVVVKNSRNAMAGISAKFFGEPSKGMSLIGITGTNGKTTITYLLEAIFKTAGKKPGVIGTIAYRFGSETRPAPHTTPESSDLQRLFSDMREKGVDVCVMEVSSHALSQERVAACNFDAAVFTNLTPEHLDYHDGMEAYFEAKAILFEKLLGESLKKGAFAVINIDDPYGRDLVKRCPVSVVTYGFDSGASVRALDFQFDSLGLYLKFSAGVEVIECRTKLCGRFNAKNILAAAAVALKMGVDVRTVKSAIENMSAVPGRFEAVANKRGITAVVDYAHTPDAIENVLLESRELVGKDGGHLIAVFGCGGDRDRKKRPVMGRAAAKLADRIIVTSDNPRTEDPDAIINEIMAGVKEALGVAPDRSKCEVIENRRDAIARAVGIAKKGDMIIVTGKGHEDYQIIGTKKHHFDDREVLKEFLEMDESG